MTELKRHDVPADVDPSDWALDITGAVSRPISLTRAALESVPTERFGEDFVCEAGWEASGLNWQGAEIGSLLKQARPSDSAKYGLVHAMDGSYACAFPIERLQASILAIELDGEPLDPVHGGPARLVPTDPGRDCWESVKWVTTIELLEDHPADRDSAKDLALSRISRD